MSYHEMIAHFVRDLTTAGAQAADKTIQELVRACPEGITWDKVIIELAPDGKLIDVFTELRRPLAPYEDRWFVRISNQTANMIRYPMTTPEPTGETMHDQTMSIVDALHLQAVDYRNRYRLAPDTRFTAVFPHNETIGREVFEVAEQALNLREIDVDWSMWPPKDAPEWQKQAWDTAPLGEADKLRHEKVDFLLYPKGSLVTDPKGSFVIEPKLPIDLAEEKWGATDEYAALCTDLLAHGYTSGEAEAFLQRAYDYWT